MAQGLFGNITDPDDRPTFIDHCVKLDGYLSTNKTPTSGFLKGQYSSSSAIHSICPRLTSTGHLHKSVCRPYCLRYQ